MNRSASTYCPSASNATIVAAVLRFAFAGKEKDLETGLSYFGARYYDADLTTGWLSVDPMANKYPSMSPYNYCALNPVKLVDPDGREIWIKGLDKNEYQYRDRKLFNKDGSAYEGTDEFAAQVLNDLNTLTDNGMKDEISKLSTSTNKHFIGYSSKDNWIQAESDQAVNDGIPCGSAIVYNHKSNSQSGWRRSAIIGLAHELKHAYDYDRGTFNSLRITFHKKVVNVSFPFVNKFGAIIYQPKNPINDTGLTKYMPFDQGEIDAINVANRVGKLLEGDKFVPRTTIGDSRNTYKLNAR